MPHYDKRTQKCGLVILTLIAFAFFPGMGVKAHAEVAIDVGHSVHRGGSTSEGGIAEFQYNQRLATAIAQRLTQQGVQVNLVNADGTIESLAARTRQAMGASIFASIHHDSVQPQFRPVVDQRFSGYSIWVSRKNRDTTGSLACARILSDRMLEAGFLPSTYHAVSIAGENHPTMDGPRGIYANDGLAVLKGASSAAILIEAGVIANPVEESRLLDPMFAATQATAIAIGLNECQRMLASRK